MKTIEELRQKFEALCREDEEKALFLKFCKFTAENVYELNIHDYDLEYYQEQINGAWWMFQKLQGSVNAVLENLNQETDRHWDNWEMHADMYDQGQANAYEHAHRLVEEKLQSGS